MTEMSDKVQRTALYAIKIIIVFFLIVPSEVDGFAVSSWTN